jgi:hypothetical protein
MNLYEFDSASNFTMREMERMDHLCTQIDWINRIARELNPLEEMARKLNPFDGLACELDQAEPLKHELDQIDRVSRDLVQDKIAEFVLPSTTIELLGQLTTGPFDSLIAEQEIFSKQLRDLNMPPDITSSLLTPPNNTSENLFGALNDLRIPVDRMEVNFPDFAFPEGCTLASLQKMSDEEIQAFVDKNPSLIALQKALHELEMRRIDRATRPHWSVTWTFWLVLISTVIAAVGVVVGTIGVYLMLR